MDRFSEMPPAFQPIKETLLREFPKEENVGVNTERVEQFIASEGLPVKPYILFYQEDYSRVERIIGSTNLLRSAFKEGACGLYSPEMDLVLVRRDRKYEEANGAIYTEGLLVHDLAHASSMYEGYVSPDERSAYTPKVGFCLAQNKIPWGWLLEEGWADMHRANYFARYAAREERNRIETALKFGSVDLEETIPMITPSGELLPVPAKYIYVTPEGKPTTKSSAYAGYALEILCRRNPSLKPLLIEARSSVDALRKLAATLNKMSPHLYATLQKTDYTEADFSAKLGVVISKIHGSLEPAIKAKGALRNKWNQLLQQKRWREKGL